MKFLNWHLWKFEIFGIGSKFAIWEMNEKVKTVIANNLFGPIVYYLIFKIRGHPTWTIVILVTVSIIRHQHCVHGLWSYTCTYTCTHVSNEQNIFISRDISIVSQNCLHVMGNGNILLTWADDFPVKTSIEMASNLKELYPNSWTESTPITDENGLHRYEYVHKISKNWSSIQWNEAPFEMKSTGIWSHVLDTRWQWCKWHRYVVDEKSMLVTFFCMLV